MSDKRRAAAVTLQRPARPITTTDLQAALTPLVELLGLPSGEDVTAIHITVDKVAVTVVPRHRGRLQHDTRLRVVYPVAFDGDTE